MRGTEMARDHGERERERDDDRRIEDSEQARLQVIHILRSILRETQMQPNGAGPVITPDMQSVIDLYAKIESQIELTCSTSVTE
jgi:hypothetical protein